MELKKSKDYIFANISDEDVLTISRLEKTLSEKAKEDIILIAYQSEKQPDSI